MSYFETKSERLASSLPNVEPRKQTANLTLDKPRSKFFDGWLFLTVGSVLIIFNLMFGLVRVSGKSMLPTLHHNNMMLVSRMEPVRRFDIAVFDERLEENGDTKRIVKRVIGLGGDRVTVVNGDLYINNQHYKEDYLSPELITAFKNYDFDIIVPKNHYFVLGDNRDISNDSRQVGSFTKDSLVGVKILQLW